jgi:hypothetical protein
VWDGWSRGGEGLKVYARRVNGRRVEDRSWVDGEGRRLWRRALDLVAESSI